ncbi:hypothetical protein, partial [Staphylococcus aureus]
DDSQEYNAKEESSDQPECESEYLSQEHAPVAEIVVKSAIEDSQYSEVVQSEISEKLTINSDSLGIKNKQYISDYVVEKPGFHNAGKPHEMVERLAMVGYQCLEFLAFQMSLLLNT